MVPADVPVKRNRVSNIDTDRLLRRLEWLRTDVADHKDRSRHQWLMRVLEAAFIERELERRQVEYRAVTQYPRRQDRWI